MRVAKTDSRRERSVAPGKRHKKSTKVERTFSEVIQTEQNEAKEIDLKIALEEVDRYAERLKESPILENLLPYKRKVRDILLFLVQESYDVQENTVYDLQGRRRLLVLVEKIDQKLEDLVRQFLNNQSDSLDLVSRLDEIRGLLLDIQI